MGAFSTSEAELWILLMGPKQVPITLSTIYKCRGQDSFQSSFGIMASYRAVASFLKSPTCILTLTFTPTKWSFTVTVVLLQTLFQAHTSAQLLSGSLLEIALPMMNTTTTKLETSTSKATLTQPEAILTILATHVGRTIYGQKAIPSALITLETS